MLDINNLIQVMRRKIYLSLVLVLFLLLQNCDSMNAIMSNYNANKCLQKGVKVAYYSTTKGKYLDDYIYHYNTKGKNVKSAETRWVKSRLKYYLNLTSFDVYYKTSPYTKKQYKFSSYCARFSF